MQEELHQVPETDMKGAPSDVPPAHYVRNASAVIALSFFSSVSTSLTGNAATTLLVTTLGGGATLLGVFNVCGAAGILTRLYASRIIARWRSVKAFLFTWGILGCIPMLLYALLLLGPGARLSPALLLCAFALYRLAQSMAAQMVLPVATAFFHTLFGKAFLMTSGRMSMAGGIGAILGALLMMQLLPGSESKTDMLRVLGVLFIVAWAIRSVSSSLILAARAPAEPPAPQKSSARTPIGDLVSLVLENSFVRNFVLVAVAANWASAGTNFLLLYAIRDVGFPKAETGSYMLTVALTGIVVSALVGRFERSLGQMRLLRLGYLLWLFGILIMPTLAQPWCLYPAAAFAAAGSLLAGITLTSILMTYCPGDKKVLAAFFLVLVPRQASAPASLGLGILGDLVGLKWLLIGSGFLFVLALRRIRTMQAAIDQGAGGGESQSPETDQTDDASSA